MITLVALFSIPCLLLILLDAFSAWKWPKEQKHSKWIQCDMCPEKCSPSGRHLKPLGNGAYFHNIHLIRQVRNDGQPVIRGTYRDNMRLRGKQEKKGQKQKEEENIERMYNEIMNQPVGEDFAKTIDIQRECDKMSL